MRGRLHGAGPTLVGRKRADAHSTADDYFSKDLSDRGHEASRGGAGQRVGYTKIGPRASPNRITQNHLTLNTSPERQNIQSLSV